MKTIGTLMDATDRVALVTGGAGHLGKVICDTLAELGADVAVLDVERGASDVAKDLEDRYNVRSIPLLRDLTDKTQAREAPGEVVDELGRLDVLVNCAAFGGDSNLDDWVAPFHDQSAETLETALSLNLTAPFILSQAAADPLERDGRGSVINIASIYGMVGPQMGIYEDTSLGNPAGYAASKGGLIQLTRWLATVMAPGVRVNAITPGGIQRNQPDGFKERYADRTPLRRMATEEDLKGAVAYLATDLSAYVTGHNLVVDGGWTVW